MSRSSVMTVSDTVGGGIDADHGIAAGKRQTIDNTGGDSGWVVRWMIRLQARGEAPGQTHRGAKPRHNANLRSHRDQVLQAHDFGYRRGHFRHQAGSQSAERVWRGLFAEKPIAKLADGQASEIR